MAITFRASASTAYGLRTNTSVSAPAGAATGTDAIAVCIDVGNTSSISITTPSGWTLAGDVVYSNADPWFVHLAIFVRIHDGSSSYTFNHASGYSQAHAGAWIGVDTTTPVDCTSATAVSPGGTTTTAVFDSITTATNGAMRIGARGSWDGNAITPPGSWVERYDSPVLWVGDLEATTAGATGSTNVPHGNGGGSSVSPWGTIHAALRPASAAANFSRPIQRRPHSGLIMRGRR